MGFVKGRMCEAHPPPTLHEMQLEMHSSPCPSYSAAETTTMSIIVGLHLLRCLLEWFLCVGETKERVRVEVKILI
jgi:hypothetical protein